MEQRVRFGLVLGWMALLHEIKNWATYEQLLRAFFHGLMGKKIILKIVVHLGTKNLYQMKGRKTDLLLKNLIMNLK